MSQASSLRSPPANDPRPLPLNDAVIERALATVREALTDWGKLHAGALSPEALMFAVQACTPKAGFDGFRLGHQMLVDFRVPVNDALTGVLRAYIAELTPACRIVTAEWVMRNGIRFPGKPGDNIEWVDEAGVRKAGRIYGVNSLLASASVIRATDERAEIVICEQVIANLDQGRYAPETPRLGARYADACAAQVAVAAGEPAPEPIAYHVFETPGGFDPKAMVKALFTDAFGLDPLLDAAQKMAADPRITIRAPFEPSVTFSSVDHVPDHIEPQPDCARCGDTGWYADPRIAGENLCDCGAVPPDGPAVA